jgi:hypothetical protein
MKLNTIATASALAIDLASALAIEPSPAAWRASYDERQTVHVAMG